MVRRKMIEAFAKATGGLFNCVEKADVGNTYEELGKKGVSLMGWADPFMPDCSMPKYLEEEWINAIKEEAAPHYTAPIGNPDLKLEIAKKLKVFNGLDVDPNRNILITPGSDSGLFFAILPFIKEDDEVLVPCPTYPNNFLDIEIMGGVVVPVKTREEDGYQLDINEMEANITDKTKMVILTHPNNPTTTVYNRKSLEGLRDLCIQHDLILVCDQAFEDFTFENEMITPASMEGMFDRTITVFSFSKGMGLSGLRVGYVVCNAEIMDTMFANAVSVIGATSTSAQKVLIKALQRPEFMKTFEDAYKIRRQEAYRILNSIPNVSCLLPESGFLCWINVEKLGKSTDIAKYIQEEAKVALNAGLNYGPGGEGHLRLVLGCYKDNEKVVDALERIKKALLKFQGLE